jgi:hypothetical protein
LAERRSFEKFLEVLANFLLFVSPLLILIDKAPRDYYPEQKELLAALNTLKAQQNIIGNLPQPVRVQSEKKGKDVYHDDHTLRVLTEFIKKESVLAKNIEWDHIGDIIGVGYSKLAVPVGGTTLEAIHPLYIALPPKDEGETKMRLIPVGMLEDMDSWLSKLHQASLIKAALTILVIGFFLQLYGAVAKLEVK